MLCEEVMMTSKRRMVDKRKAKNEAGKANDEKSASSEPKMAMSVNEPCEARK